MKKLLLIGGGGHCKSVLDILLQNNEYDKIGIIDQPEAVGNKILGIPIIGCDADLAGLYQDGYRYSLITIGSIDDTTVRERIDDALKTNGFKIPTVVDESAAIGMDVRMEPGAIIGKKAVVNVGTTVGRHAIINSGCVIEHDCQIGDFVHVAPGTTICGGSKIQNYTLVGAGSVVKQGVVIGERTVIGAGSVVTKDIPSGVTAFGNPCKVRQTESKC